MIQLDKASLIHRPKAPSLQVTSHACYKLTLLKIHIQVYHVSPEGFPSATPMQEGLCTKAHRQSDGALNVGSDWHPPGV